MSSRGRHEQTSEDRRCVFAWCTTEHGATVHPDDEDHRSRGTGLTARVRRGAARGSGVLTDVEVGLLQRGDDSETWVVVETSDGTSICLPVHAVRALIARVGEDRPVAAVLSPREDLD